MPWSAQSFRSKHNHGLTDSQATHAASQANAMLKAGVPEGEAIATANKRAENPAKAQANGQTLDAEVMEFDNTHGGPNCQCPGCVGAAEIALAIIHAYRVHTLELDDQPGTMLAVSGPEVRKLAEAYLMSRVR